MSQLITNVFQGYTTAELARILDAAGIVNSPIASVAQVFQDPQVLARDMVQHVEHPTAGRIRLTGPAVKYSRTPARIRSAPPLLGQHTVEVLRDVLGMSPSEIAQLADAGVIRCTALPDVAQAS
jgi:succinate--hydroxymethylglutarate CoA-transferase